MADLGYVLEVNMSGFSDGLDGGKGCDEIKRETKDNVKISGLIQLSSWG